MNLINFVDYCSTIHCCLQVTRATLQNMFWLLQCHLSSQLRRSLAFCTFCSGRHMCCELTLFSTPFKLHSSALRLSSVLSASLSSRGIFAPLPLFYCNFYDSGFQWYPEYACSCSKYLSPSHVQTVYQNTSARSSDLVHSNTHTRLMALSGTTQVSRYQKGKTNLGFTEARDSEWQWHQLGHMQVCTSLQTDNHVSTSPLSFFTGRMPFLSPNQHRQSTEGTSQ